MVNNSFIYSKTINLHTKFKLYPLFLVKTVKLFQVFIYNLAGATTIFCWSLVTSIILFGLLQYYGILRVSKEEELIGLDISKHNEIAYPIIGSSVNNCKWYLKFLERVSKRKVLPFFLNLQFLVLDNGMQLKEISLNIYFLLCNFHAMQLLLMQ